MQTASSEPIPGTGVAPCAAREPQPSDTVDIVDDVPDQPNRPRTARRRSMFAVAATAILLLSACNGDDDATPSTVTAETSPPLPTIPPELTTSTTETPTTTTTASTTTPITTISQSSTSTTAPGPTSTGSVIITDPVSPEAQEMLAAFERHFAAFVAMLENPADQSTVDAVMATVVGDMELTVQNTLELLDERNQVVIPNPDLATQVIVVDESLTLDQSGAGFDACLIDGGTLVDRDAADPTPGPPTSRSVTYSLSKIDGVWLTATLDFFAEFPGEIGCS